MGDLEAALFSLVLHILLALALDGSDAAAASEVTAAGTAAANTSAGAGATAALLAEYADELLVSFFLFRALISSERRGVVLRCQIKTDARKVRFPATHPCFVDVDEKLFVFSLHDRLK